MPYACRFLCWTDSTEDFKWWCLHFQLWGLHFEGVYFEGPNHIWKAWKTSIFNNAHMSFILKGCQILAFQLKGWFKSKTHMNLCMNHMVHVSSIMWRMKNQPSNSASCSDKCPTLVVFVLCKLYWGIQVMTSSFSIWGRVLKGCFVRGLFWRAKPHLKGMKDFNFEHCSGGLHGGGREPWIPRP